MEHAGLGPAQDVLSRYPHELSGGQRIATVRAMLLVPDLLVADELVSMLDVPVRADTLNQLLDLRDGAGMGIVFITHDLAVSFTVRASWAAHDGAAADLPVLSR